MKITIEIEGKERVHIEDDHDDLTLEDIYKITRMFKYRLGLSLGFKDKEIKKIRVTKND